MKNYTGESIEELLPERYRGLAPSLMALLFDGYDELTGDMVQRFEAQLAVYDEEAGPSCDPVLPQQFL